MERFRREVEAARQQQAPSAIQVSAAEFRRDIIGFVRGAERLILSHVQGRESKWTAYDYRLSSAVVDDLMERIEGVIELLEGAEVSSIATGLAAARADSRFQHFLAAQCITIAGE